jgi:hypothetical protein
MESVLNQYAEKGLSSCFVISRTGDIAVARDAEGKKDQLMQMALVVFETIGAIGEVKIDKIEIVGDSRGLIMQLGEESLLGSLFENREGVIIEELWMLLEDIKSRPAAAVGERTQEILDAALLGKMKRIMADYLGDFTDRIYKNQLKAQGITVEELSPKDVHRLIATVTKAASMIIGPTKSREMRNKLLNLLK